jgi:hypothetical protein
LRRWRRKSDSPGEQEILGQLIERQRFQLDEAVAQYRSWWTAERAEMLRQGLATLIGQHGVGDQPARADEVEESESAVSQA